MKYFSLSIQNEYMCDTTAPPAQAEGFGDYVIIPDGVDSSTSKVDGCVLSNHPAKIPVPTISKYSLLSTLQEIKKTQNFPFRFCGNKLSCILNNQVSAEVMR